MADLDLLNTSESLPPSARVRWVEIDTNVYALASSPALPSGESLPVSVSLPIIVNDSLYQSRLGRQVTGWVNDYIAGAAGLQVLAVGPIGNQPGIYYNLQPDTHVFISQISYGVLTINDNCSFEVGWCDGVNATGLFTPVAPQRNITTGAAIAGFSDRSEDLIPAIGPLAYSAGVRSITCRIDPNDITCEIALGWRGWWEPE